MKLSRPNLSNLLKVVLFCCCVLLAQILNAQDKKFRNISVDKGLSQSTGFTIAQDTLGFIWVGTQDGLNRYNGNDFKVYRPIKGQPRSLQSYYIRSLHVDQHGSLWIGGNQGISKYDYKSDNFVNYKLPKSVGEWYISSIAEDKNGVIWAVSISGDIFKLNINEQQFARINVNTLDQGIKKIAYVGVWKSQILLGTDVGLFSLSHQKNLKKLDIGKSRPFISDVFVNHQYLWIATEGDGLIRYEQKSGKLDFFENNPLKNSVADNNIRCISNDRDGNIWLGTFKGLSILNVKTLSFDNYQHQSSQPFSIGQNSVRSIFKDKQHGMWLGTYYGGISYYHKDDIKFNLLSQNTGKLALNDEVVSVIKQDKAGNFWIGTNDKGLNYWNRSKETISYFTYKASNANSLASNNIKAIAFDNSGNVLVGTHNGGLNLLNPQTGNIKRFLHNASNPNSIAGDLVYSLLKDAKGRIWVGTRSGLDEFMPKEQNFKHITIDRAGKRLVSDDITYLYEDSRHRIWIGTTNGVSQFYPDNLLFGNIEESALKEEVVNCIVEDARKRIWIGTRGGLWLYEEKRNAFVPFKSRNDFVKGTIYGILPDEMGNLWISTNSGLVKFNPDTKYSQTFYDSDGLQNNQFNEYAFCKANDGMMLFGGIKGLSYFYPNSLRQAEIPIKLYFTGVEVFNKQVAADDGTDVLANHVDQVNELRFAADQKQFSIAVNSFNYISPNRTLYYYKLLGIDKDWQRAVGQKISYSNLPAGHYELEVRAEGPNGERSKIRKIAIVISPPWYKTVWFYLFMVMLLGCAGYFAYKILRERIRAINQLKLERLDKERAKEINQIKTDFFTNVSHELRTPLTLILAPLEELMNTPKVDRPIKQKYELMFANAKRLYQLVDQLFEFRKTEMGTRKLRVSKTDLVSFLAQIYESFKPLANRKNIGFSYRFDVAQLSFFFDDDALERVLFNLLSNAFKYTKDGGNIVIQVSAEQGNAVIEVVDNGLGIKAEDLEKLFERFYQVNGTETNLGSGVGLAFTKSLVELHHGTISASSDGKKGSVFTVKLPLADVHYSDDLKLDSEVAQTVDADQQQIEANVLDEGNVDAAESVAQKLKLLIVDDNVDIVGYLRDFFELQYDVVTAYNGKMGIKAVEAESFDLIISDVMMPEMDGLNFCKRVKQNINTSHIPLILLTAKADTSHHIKGLEMGADDYLTKPFSAELLAAKVENLLRSRKRLKDYYLSNKALVPENIAFNTLDEEFLKEAIEIIEKHLSDSDFSVDKFSREIGMSRSNLYLKLKAITGESATDFVKRIKFSKAVEFMKSNRYTMAQIAYMCGFNSPSYFSTAFKQYFDCMPTEYLEKLKRKE